ncbi:MAG: HEAT repeat domain-containing protein [Chitinispirillaceae bacterium]
MEQAQALEYLKSSKPDQVISALRFLVKHGSVSDLSAIMALISSENPLIRKTATDTACAIIKENLINNFHQLTPELRHKLGSILQSLDPRIIDEISKDLFCDDEKRRLTSLQVLGILRRHPRTRELLAKLVQDRDVKIKATAVNLLGKMVGPHDQEIVLSLLNDPDKRVKANTVEALEKLGNKRMVPILLRLRHDPNNRIRANVLKALFSLGYTEVESDLLEMLDSNEYMKASALWVISQIKIQSTYLEDAAGSCLLSSSSMVYRNALNALKALNTPRACGYLRYLENSVV